MTSKSNLNMSPTVRFVSAWLPVGVWMAAIVLLPRIFDTTVRATLPTPQANSGQITRYVIHAVLYAVLTGLVCRAWLFWSAREAVMGALGLSARTSLLVFTNALFDEFQQGFLPNRQPSLEDLLADGIGIIAALIIIIVFFNRRKLHED